jgi:hypothetical protein
MPFAIKTDEQLVIDHALSGRVEAARRHISGTGGDKTIDVTGLLAGTV